MSRIKDIVFPLLTSGKYTGIQDEKDIDAVIRLIVLNITYTIASILVIILAISDMRSGLTNQGMIELIIGFLIFVNLLLLRTELPFIIGGFIVITIFGVFCGISIFSKNQLEGFGSLWIYSYPLMSIFTLGLKFGLIPALILFAVTIAGTFIPGLTSFHYTPNEAILLCGVYFFTLALTVIYEYVRSIKDRWLSRQDSYMNMVFANSPDIILLLDKSGKLVYCADVFLKKAGIHSFDEIRKHHYTDVFSRFNESALLDEIVSHFETAETEKKPIVFEREMDIGRNGDMRHYEIHFTPMFNDMDIFQGAFMLFHDSTDITRAKEHLEQASMAKSNFLAAMSHEIRTPLNAIIGMATIAESTDELERIKYCLTKIDGASTQLLEIINDILDMSKIEEGKFELSCAEFDFSDMLQRLAASFEFRLNEKKQQFAMTTNPSLPARIITDEQRLAQVIANLLGNSVKFTPDEGKVSLEVSRIDSAAGSGGGEGSACILEFRVTDTGIGISKEQQQKLFRPFVQVDSSISRKFGGTGLGLAISKKIVELMQGEIRVESEVGHGAIFIFTVKATLPLQAAKDTTAADAGEDGSGDWSGKKILLAEDVEINREIVITLLEDFGIEIVEAEDGQQAYDKFAADVESFDLVFMDIHMPGTNGYESTKLIRSFDHPKAKTIPIIAMTANVFQEDIDKCLASGMNEHIGKPLNFEEVAAVLTKYFNKH